MCIRQTYSPQEDSEWVYGRVWGASEEGRPSGSQGGTPAGCSRCPSLEGHPTARLEHHPAPPTQLAALYCHHHTLSLEVRIQMLINQLTVIISIIWYILYNEWLILKICSIPLSQAYPCNNLMGTYICTVYVYVLQLHIHCILKLTLTSNTKFYYKWNAKHNYSCTVEHKVLLQPQWPDIYTSPACGTHLPHHTGVPDAPWPPSAPPPMSPRPTPLPGAGTPPHQTVENLSLK